jgi:Family of unknown function (DUF6328)
LEPGQHCQIFDETMRANVGRPIDERSRLSLAQAAQYLLDEARMVLPGIQALFGFQLIVVFNPAFAQQLSPGEQLVHLLALALVAAAVALVMAPAAHHRQTRPHEVTERFVRLSTRLLLCSMWPLAVGIALDFYLVSRVILDASAARWLSSGLFGFFVGLWFVMPWSQRFRDRHSSGL